MLNIRVNLESISFNNGCLKVIQACHAISLLVGRKSTNLGPFLNQHQNS